jgi:PAS domain S-box-containing protein
MAATKEQAPGGIAHETGELHRLLVESVRDYAIFALDPNGYILSWNPGAQRFKGYTAEEVIGKHFSIFYPAEKVAEGFPAFELREAARTGRFEDEGWRIRKDGTRFWANVVITALRGERGELVGFAKVTRDLTRRREAEEALRLSEERFRLLVEVVKDYAIFMLDPTGHIATWNEGARRIKGYSAEEIIGKHFSIFYPPEKVAEGFPDYELREAARVGRFEDEGWRIRKDGTRFWANVVITALRNREGDLIGFGKVTRDLTERRAAEQRAIEDARRVAAEEAARRAADEARRRSDKLQALTSALSSAHTVEEVTDIVFGEGFTMLAVDAGAVGFAKGASRDIALVADRGYGELPGWARRVELTDDVPMAEVVRTGRIVECQTRAERDARFPATAKLLAAYGTMMVLPLTGRGKTVGALALHWRREHALDQDERIFVAAFAQQCAQALERAQLYEAEQGARREAEEARARADEANRAKSVFLATMSHELRTPLNAIAGYAQLLALGVDGAVNERQVEKLERIRRSQDHLLRIINDLLNFSRIEAGHIAYTFAEFPLHEVLEAVGGMIAPQAAAKGLTFSTTRCPPEAVAWADRSKTEQILLNLLSNAVKFTPAGGDVILCCDRADDTRVELSVKDTGEGIPADKLHTIFEPFVQIGRSLSSTREGTGLGLAISRDLARAMGGDICVESRLGHGSQFTLTLPSSAGGTEHKRPVHTRAK